MATDWPGHASSNRNVHIPANCTCRKIFTDGNEPPWFYEAICEQAVPPSWWTWMLTTKFLYPNESAIPCEFRYQFLDPDALEFREILLTLEIVPGSPNDIVSILRATRIGGVQTSQYVNVQVNPVIPGPKVPRPTIFPFDAEGWIKIVDEPIEQGDPNLVIFCFPKDCQPGWQWGELLPAEIP